MNKTVLLRERKRHTAHRIASTGCSALSGGGYSGYPTLPGPGMGYPPYLGLGWGTLPTLTWDGVPPYLDLGWGTPLPRPEMGYLPSVNRLKILPSPILWMAGGNDLLSRHKLMISCSLFENS